MTERAGLGRRSSHGVDPASVDLAGRARQAAGAAQVARSKDLQAKDPPYRRLHDLARRPRLPASFVSPGPIYEPEGRRHRVRCAGALRRRVSRRRYGAQHLLVSPHPSGRDGRERRRGARLRGDPGRHRPDRTAIAHASPICGRSAMSGRPSFLKVLLDRAASEGGDTSSLKKALVGGGKPCRRRCAPNSAAVGLGGAAVLRDRGYRHHRL